MTFNIGFSCFCNIWPAFSMTILIEIYAVASADLVIERINQGIWPILLLGAISRGLCLSAAVQDLNTTVPWFKYYNGTGVSASSLKKRFGKQYPTNLGDTQVVGAQAVEEAPRAKRKRCGYIRSGALIPMSSSERRKTIWADSTSFNRAKETSRSSGLAEMTRQFS